MDQLLADRKYEGRLRTQIFLAQFCCFLIFSLQCFALASAESGRGAAPPAAGSKFISIGLKAKTDQLNSELTSAKANTWNEESSPSGSGFRFGLISWRHLSNVLGSVPPQCISKCRSCTPCRPVRVPIHPGTIKLAEYYPEAWRCQCAGNLYMP